MHNLDKILHTVYPTVSTIEAQRYFDMLHNNELAVQTKREPRIVPNSAPDRIGFIFRSLNDANK